MDRFSVEELVHITKGTILKKGRVPFIVGAAIDSRAVKADELYIPIVGESLDGHRFIPGAVSNGASVVLTEQGDVELPEDTTVILVDSTVEALKSLGAANRSRCDIPVVSVTGSSGKTTTKDVIASVLSQSYKTMKTQGNYNNQLGIPQTLFQLDSSHEAAVVEMGMDHLGDLHQSIGEVLPHYAVITNVGTAHLEYLKTQENILKAKMETLETLTAEDYAIINGDDPYLSTISNKAYHIIRVGIEAADLDFRATDISSSARGLSFVVQGETYRFAYPGIHNVYNALAAIWIAKDLKMTAGEIQAGLDAFVPSGNRMKLATIDDITYIDDSYNANTDAMRAAINVLVDMGETAEPCGQPSTCWWTWGKLQSIKSPF